MFYLVSFNWVWKPTWWWSSAGQPTLEPSSCQTCNVTKCELVKGGSKREIMHCSIANVPTHLNIWTLDLLDHTAWHKGLCKAHHPPVSGDEAGLPLITPQSTPAYDIKAFEERVSEGYAQRTMVGSIYLLRKAPRAMVSSHNRSPAGWHPLQIPTASSLKEYHSDYEC